MSSEQELQRPGIRIWQQIRLSDIKERLERELTYEFMVDAKYRLATDEIMLRVFAKHRPAWVGMNARPISELQKGLDNFVELVREDLERAADTLMRALDV